MFIFIIFIGLIMEVIFETDNWDDDVPESEGSFSFKKTKNKKKQKMILKNDYKNNDKPGQFVRAPPKEKFAENADVDEGVKTKKRKTETTYTEKDDVPEKNLKIERNPLPLKQKLIDSLKGSRFRYLNEQLYKTTGDEAKKLFKQDPEAFLAYHEGYRYQLQQWEMDPLNRIINNIRKLPKDYVVADFGCGEGRLAKSVTQKVYSLDLVAANESVVACDMANTPLESHSINVVVFCLSLMGTNIKDFLLEANRVMKTGGILKVAEISSRFDSVKLFIDCVAKCGFELVNKDLEHKIFSFFNFKKDRNVDKTIIKVKDFSLKPCLYKKR